MPRTLALLLALAAPAVVAAQGKLDAVRDAVEKSNPDSRPSDDSRSGDAALAHFDGACFRYRRRPCAG